MKKDEILELSKKENAEGDEREKKVKSRGQFIAMNVNGYSCDHYSSFESSFWKDIYICISA